MPEIRLRFSVSDSEADTRTTNLLLGDADRSPLSLPLNCFDDISIDEELLWEGCLRYFSGEVLFEVEMLTFCWIELSRKELFLLFLPSFEQSKLEGAEGGIFTFLESEEESGFGVVTIFFFIEKIGDESKSSFGSPWSTLATCTEFSESFPLIRGKTLTELWTLDRSTSEVLWCPDKQKKEDF